MQVTHPRALDEIDLGPPPSFVSVDGERVPVADDGTFEADDNAWLRNFAAGYGLTVDDLTQTESTGGDEDGGEDWMVDPSTMTVDDLEAYLADSDLDDETIEALLAAEEDGKNRETALAALHDAIEEE